MALINRIVVTLLLLALIPILTVGLIVPREALQLISDGVDEFESQFDQQVSAWQLLIRVGLAVLIDGVLILLLYLQLRRPATHGVPVRTLESGEAEIAVNSVVEQLEYHIDPLPGVLAVKPTVIPRRGAVEVALEIEMAADLNLSTNIEQISAVARRVIEDEMGLKLKGRPKLKLHTIPYPEAVVRPDLTGPAFETAGPQLPEAQVLEPVEEAFARPEVAGETEAIDTDDPGSAIDDG